MAAWRTGRGLRDVLHEVEDTGRFFLLPRRRPVTHEISMRRNGRDVSCRSLARSPVWSNVLVLLWFDRDCRSVGADCLCHGSRRIAQSWDPLFPFISPPPGFFHFFSFFSPNLYRYSYSPFTTYRSERPYLHLGYDR